MISRRFNGDFDLADGIKGLLWAIDELRDEEPDRADAILRGFDAWGKRYATASRMEGADLLLSS